MNYIHDICAPNVRRFTCPGPAPGKKCGAIVETRSRNKERCDKCARARILERAYESVKRQRERKKRK